MAEELAGSRVVGVDAAVAEVTDQQITTEAAEPGRGTGQAQAAVGAVDVDEAAALADDLVLSAFRDHLINALQIFAIDLRNLQREDEAEQAERDLAMLIDQSAASRTGRK